MTTILVAGALASKPGNGGEAWVRLSWMRGLARLGFDVWFVEELAPGCEFPGARPWFTTVTAEFGFADRAILLDASGRVLQGPADVAPADVAASAELLINISGNLRVAELLAAPRRRAYLDLDPGYTQVWHRDGALGDALARHEHLLTVALSVDRPGSRLPLAALRWRPVPPPVVLADWPASEASPAGTPRVTTVASWRGGYGRLQDGERLYGQKAHEFRRLAALPTLRPQTRFELALAIDPSDCADAALLRDHGWALVEPTVVAGDPASFRRYVVDSTAELSPAQGVYVETRCGWFSDRTTRYLASGRPAIVQATGLPAEIPIGEGLLTFRSADEAATAVDRICADYDTHARAARALAEEWFDADRVLGDLLTELL